MREREGDVKEIERREARQLRATVHTSQPSCHKVGMDLFVANENIFQLSLELILHFTHSNPLIYFAFHPLGIFPWRTEPQSPLPTLTP